MTTLTMKRGGVSQWQLQVLTRQKAPVNVTGIKAAKFVMRSSKPASTVTNDADADLVCSLATGEIEIEDNLLGKLSLVVPHAKTILLAEKRYYFDIVIIDAADQVHYLDSGTVDVETNYARSPGT